MADKFKVGDIVRVRKSCALITLKGKLGLVLIIADDKDVDYEYHVVFLEGLFLILGPIGYGFLLKSWS